MLIIMFFAIGALFIIENNNLQMYEKRDFAEFSRLYTAWLNQIYKNAQFLTGEAVKLEWLLNEEDFAHEKNKSNL